MIKVPDNYDPPAIPTGHLGQSIVIRSIVDETHGMPENHANIDLQRNFQIGNDTLPRSKSYLTENIGEPMYKLLNSKLKDSPVVMADETLFPVLSFAASIAFLKK